MQPQTTTLLIWKDVLAIRQEDRHLERYLKVFVTLPIKLFSEEEFDRRVKGMDVKKTEDGGVRVAFHAAPPEILCFVWDGKRPGACWFSDGENTDPRKHLVSRLALPCFAPNMTWTLYTSEGTITSPYKKIGKFVTEDMEGLGDLD